MSRRRVAAVAILGLWLVGLALLVRRELFRPDTERLAEMGLRVAPTALFYAVMSEGRHVGFASSTVDTTESAITVVDYLVADLPAAGGTRRTSTRTSVELSRGMRLQRYLVESTGPSGATFAAGTVEGDSVITAIRRGAGGAAPDTQRVRVAGPLMMPTLLPIAVVLGNEPEVGGAYTVEIFDPVTAVQRTASLRIAAESLFALHDSAAYDPVARRWKGALPVETRAWKLEGADTTRFTGWVDEQGRVVRGAGPGSLELVRMPYELAYQNWLIDKQGVASAPADPDDRVFMVTALAAGIRDVPALASLRVRLRGVDLGAFDMGSGRQARHGDTVAVGMPSANALDPRYSLGQLTRNLPEEERRRWTQYLRDEPLIETMDPDIRRRAARLRGSERDPRVVAERILTWVHDSLAKQATFGIPSARAVLESRAGDANEHTQLYIALARSAGLPARAAAGLVHVNGKFYYHAWPEIYLGDWVAVDPTLGRFPADASQLRFVAGNLGRQAELLRLIGSLDIDVLETR